MKKTGMILALVIVALIYVLYGSNTKTREADNALKPVLQTQQQTQRAVAEKIDALTQEKRVVSYLQKHNKLPDYYVSKRTARNAGWKPERQNLCDVLPGNAIGGDKFMNREQHLPIAVNRQWYEADINYNCGARGSDRLLYSSDGLIYVTKDHYKSVEQIK